MAPQTPARRARCTALFAIVALLCIVLGGLFLQRGAPLPTGSPNPQAVAESTGPAAGPMKLVAQWVESPPLPQPTSYATIRYAYGLQMLVQYGQPNGTLVQIKDFDPNRTSDGQVVIPPGSGPLVIYSDNGGGGK